MFYSVPLLSTQTVTAPSAAFVFVNINISSIFGPVFSGPPFSAQPCSVTTYNRSARSLRLVGDFPTVVDYTWIMFYGISEWQ